MMLQSVRGRRRQQARLAHAAPGHFANPVRVDNQFFAAAQGRAHRRAQALAKAHRHAVKVAGDAPCRRRRGLARLGCGHGGVEQARAIQMRCQPVLARQRGDGTWETNKISSAFVPKHLRRKYFHGAVWFGYRKQFLNMCEQLSLNVNSDLAFKYIAVWHDESHLNKYAAYNNVYSLGPEFSGVNKYRNLKNIEFLIITEEKRFGEGRAPTNFSPINAK